MSAVWVVRDADGYPRGVSMWRWSAIDDADFGGDDLAMEELSGGSDGPFNGFTVTRETLCTPAQAAVIAAAKAQLEALESSEDCSCPTPRCEHHDAWMNAAHMTDMASRTLRDERSKR